MKTLNSRTRSWMELQELRSAKGVRNVEDHTQ
jgi:hypothetical protein